jgi:hypothetical protein
LDFDFGFGFGFEVGTMFAAGRNATGGMSRSGAHCNTGIRRRQSLTSGLMQILRQRGRLRSQVICRRRDGGRADVRMRAAKERPAAHPIASTCRGIARR